MNAIDGMACAKPGCDNRGNPGLTIVGHGSCATQSGRRRRYRCTVCGGTLSPNTGTAYSGRRGARRECDQVASRRVEGVSMSATARDRTIRSVKKLGRRRWKKASGYHRQARVENAFFRYKLIVGDGLRARSPAGQGSEVVLGCDILNRMTALGRPASYGIGM